MALRMLIALLAAAGVFSFCYLAYHTELCRRRRRWALAIAGFVSLLAGAVLVSLYWHVYTGRYANLAAAVVEMAFLLGLPTAPMAIATAVLTAREKRKLRMKARKERAAQAVRAWRKKKTDAQPATRGQTGHTGE